MTNKCIHMTVSCLNQYELIRKYICEKCNEVMMCSCDEEHGQRFLPHQIHFGFWLHSQERVPVTLGFQPKICPECRGEKPVAVPKASMYGATSKIMRYYWREISFETTRRYYDAHPEQNQNDGLVSAKFFSEERRKIKEEVIKDIKLLHKINPKYEYSEVSQQQIISETETEVILINAEYVRTESRKARIQTGSKISSVEEVAANYFKAQGYQVMVVESVPFHVLFGVFMFLIIQDPGDDKGQFVQFGSRFDFDTKVSSEGLITTKLPKDFGTNGYYKRQEKLIKQHILDLDDIEWLFEYWLEHSYEFRQYLWAHREEDIINPEISRAFF